MSSDKSIVHDGPNESKYWHFRCNDISEEQYQHLLTVDVDYINIGAIEPNKVGEGSHFHTILKFKRSYGLRSVMKMVLYNLKLNPFDWYLATKYRRTKNLQTLVKYAIKNGSRFTTEEIVEEPVVIVQDYPSPEVDENDPEFRPCPEAWYLEQSVDLTLCTPYQKNQLRIYHAKRLNFEWFKENDYNFSNTRAYKTMAANCQHRKDLPYLTRKCNWYIYGENAGKTSLIHFLFPDHYRKATTNEKWDAYSNYKESHKVVCIDTLNTVSDFDKCLGCFHEFKTITDFMPFRTDSHYGSFQVSIRPERIIIISDIPISLVLETCGKNGRKVHNAEFVGTRFQRRFNIMSIDEAHDFTGTYFDPIKKSTFYNPEVDHFCTKTDTIIYKNNDI